MRKYSAKYISGPRKGRVIYASVPEERIGSDLPMGWQVADDPGTLNRRDGGDPWEKAYLEVLSGDKIEVKRD